MAEMKVQRAQVAMRIEQSTATLGGVWLGVDWLGSRAGVHMTREEARTVAAEILNLCPDCPAAESARPSGGSDGHE